MAAFLTGRQAAQRAARIACACAALGSGGALAQAAADPQVPGPSARIEVAAGVWLVRGGMHPDRQPDGNSVVFAVPRGLVVVDTGRHAWHRDAIVALAHERKQDIVAIINTHWHLDHVSGNPALRQAYPRLRVYASDAIDAALSGFLAQSARDSAAYLADASIPASMRADIAADAATVEHGQALRPDVVIHRSGARDLGGRQLQFHLAHDAVTAGDLWLYDPRSHVAVLGDLVTMPAPFLDTACPQGWLDALRDVDRVDFTLAIPGHGEPMTRAAVALYRTALTDFISCANSSEPAATCASHWLAAVGPLLGNAAGSAETATGLTRYYVDLLRANGGRSAYCNSAATAPAH